MWEKAPTMRSIQAGPASFCIPQTGEPSLTIHELLVVLPELPRDSNPRSGSHSGAESHSGAAPPAGCTSLRTPPPSLALLDVACGLRRRHAAWESGPWHVQRGSLSYADRPLEYTVRSARWKAHLRKGPKGTACARRSPLVLPPQGTPASGRPARLPRPPERTRARSLSAPGPVVEAAGVEPASASGSCEGPTCVDRWESRRGRSAIHRPRGQPSGVSRPFARRRSERTSPTHRRFTMPPRAGDSGSGLHPKVRQPVPDQSWQLCVFSRICEDRDLGTHLHIHQTRRNRDAPGCVDALSISRTPHPHGCGATRIMIPR